MRWPVGPEGIGRSAGIRAWCRAAAVALLVSSIAFVPAYGARWTPDSFLIGGYAPGDPERTAVLLALDEAGFDVVINGDRYGERDALRMVARLDSLRAARPGFRLRPLVDFRPIPARPDMITFNPNVGQGRQAVAKRLEPSGGINTPGVFGWTVWDEPLTAQDMGAIGNTTALLDSLPATTGRLAFVNLLPFAATGQQRFQTVWGRDPVPAYRRYLTAYLDQYRVRGRVAPILSADIYPFQTGGRSPEHFLNLALLAQAAAAYSTPAARIPLGMVVQVSPLIHGTRRFPTPDSTRLRWQVNAALAYGAKAIFWWTVGPTSDGEYGPGLVDEAGQRTASFATVREIDARLHAWGPTLMGFEPIAVRHQTTEGDTGIENQRFDPARPALVVRDLGGGDGAGLVGLFRASPGDEAVLVMNKSLDRSHHFDVTLTAPADSVGRIGEGDGGWRTVSRASAVFTTPDLPPGGAVLYRVRRR